MSENSLLHWGKEGINAFSTHFKNLSIYRAIRRLLSVAMENKNCPLVENNIFSVVDYGTADGANFFNILQDIKGQVSKKYGNEKEILIQLNDLPSNDFKSVWNNINGLEDEKGVYFATVAQSFYKQCFPSNSVHLGFATVVSNHMQRFDNLEVKGTMWPNVVQDDKAKCLITSVMEMDWQEFLLQRSQELASGGILICTCTGTDAEDDWIWRQALFEPVDSVWKMLYNEGYISKNEMDAGFIPNVTRSASEHKKPFLDPKSPVSKSGLELVHFEKLRISWLEYYKDIYEGKVTVENQTDILMELAHIRTGFFKAIHYPYIYRCLNTDRSESERKDIMEKYLEKFAQHFSSSKIWLDIPDDAVYHVMIIKQK